jgi:hypothetical protein
MFEQSDDPFGPPDNQRDASDATFGPVIPEEVRRQFAGRWVLLRGYESPVVVAAADDLEELRTVHDRRPDDVAVYVRDPQRTYG